ASIECFWRRTNIGSSSRSRAKAVSRPTCASAWSPEVKTRSPATPCTPTSMQEALTWGHSFARRDLECQPNRRALLGVFSHPGPDFFAELLLDDATEVIGVLDLDHGPIAAHFLQRSDV